MRARAPWPWDVPQVPPCLVVGDTRPVEPVPARFVSRPNRFVAVVELENGRHVRAYVPNTGRLTHLTEPGTPYLVVRDGTPPRLTEYTATRAWDGTWVALDAARAPRLLVDWLGAGHPFPRFGLVESIQTEVTVGKHRLDLHGENEQGPVWIEVKSGGRASGGNALLSQTPSTRGVAHLDALAELARSGELAAAAFVLQRSDVESLVVGGDAHPGWVEAVRAARDGGVTIAAYGCEVSETAVTIDRELPVIWEA